MHKKVKSIKILIVSLFYLLGAANSLAETDKAPAQLDDGWPVAKPSEVGFNPEKLGDLKQAILSGDIENIHAIAIERNGQLVYEEYFTGADERWGISLGDDIVFQQDTLHDLRSVSKSVTTALLGIALGDNYAEALSKPVVSYFPDKQQNFSKEAQKVTLQHALTMTAGLQWNEMTEPYTSTKNDELAMLLTDDPISMVLGRDAVNPVGEKWYYNGGLTHVVGGIINRMTNTPLEQYAEKVLFKPLGIEEYEWMGARRWQLPSAASGLRLRLRDLAKIGSVYLHNGKWKDKQIVPSSWIEASTKAYVESVPWSGPLASYGYGFMWYPGVTREYGGLRIIRATGWGGQRILYIPDLNLSMTIFAGNYRGQGRGNDAKVMKHIMAALEK